MVQEYVRAWLRGAGDAWARAYGGPGAQHLLDPNDPNSSSNGAAHRHTGATDVTSAEQQAQPHCGSTAAAGELTINPAASHHATSTDSVPLKLQRNGSGAAVVGGVPSVAAGREQQQQQAHHLPSLSFEVYVDSDDEDEVGGLLPHGNTNGRLLSRRRAWWRAIRRLLCCL
jgi:hypothetical protein